MLQNVNDMALNAVANPLGAVASGMGLPTRPGSADEAVADIFGWSHERMRHAAWRELREREAATSELMVRIRGAREKQAALLAQVADTQARQLRQLDEVSTELWNVWKIVADLPDIA